MNTLDLLYWICGFNIIFIPIPINKNFQMTVIEKFPAIAVFFCVFIDGCTQNNSGDIFHVTVSKRCKGRDDMSAAYITIDIIGLFCA